MGNRKFRQMAEHGLLRYPFFAFERGNPSLKETAILYLPQTGRLADLPAIRQAHASYTAFSLTSLTNRHIAYLCYGSPQLQTTNKNFGLVFF